MKKKYTALGAYIFAGGFTRGVLDSRRFEVVEHLEEGMYGVPTAKLNFPKLPIRVGLDTWEPERWKNKIDLVYGNPPCAAWSRLNGKKKVSNLSWKRDPRVDCTRNHFKLLEMIRPKVWVWESVDMVMNAGAEFVYELSQEAVLLGYAISHLRFDAQYVGGAHCRLRYFMIAHKYAINFGDAIDFVSPPMAGDVLASHVDRSADDRIFLPLPKKHVAAYKKTKPGWPLREAWDAMNPNPEIRTASTGATFVVGRPSFKNLRIDPNAVCPTVVGLNVIHPSEPRHLSIGEMKTVCGYPPTWKLEKEGSDSSARWDLFTRAVMPPIGRWIAKIIADSLDDAEPLRKKFIQVIDARKKDRIDIVPWQYETKQLNFEM